MPNVLLVVWLATHEEAYAVGLRPGPLCPALRITLRPDGTWQLAAYEPMGRELDPDGGQWHWVIAGEV